MSKNPRKPFGKLPEAFSLLQPFSVWFNKTSKIQRQAKNKMSGVCGRRCWSCISRPQHLRCLSSLWAICFQKGTFVLWIKISCLKSWAPLAAVHLTKLNGPIVLWKIHCSFCNFRCVGSSQEYHLRTCQWYTNLLQRVREQHLYSSLRKKCISSPLKNIYLDLDLLRVFSEGDLLSRHTHFIHLQRDPLDNPSNKGMFLQSLVLVLTRLSGSTCQRRIHNPCTPHSLYKNKKPFRIFWVSYTNKIQYTGNSTRKTTNIPCHKLIHQLRFFVSEKALQRQEPPKTKIWLSGPWIILCPNLFCLLTDNSSFVGEIFVGVCWHGVFKHVEVLTFKWFF